MISINSRFATQRLTGVQRYAYEISRQLIHKQCDISLVSPNTTLPVYKELPLKHRGYASGYYWEQVELPRLAKNTILWSPCNIGPILHNNQIVTIHDVYSINNPEWVSRGFHEVYKVILPLLSRRAKRILTVSEYSKTQIVETLRIRDDKIIVIPNGVGNEFFIRNNKLEMDKLLEKKYGIKKPYILTLGSIEPRKNIKRTILAWNQLGEDKPNLVIAGGKGSSKIFSEMPIIADDPKIKFTGYIDEEDLPSLYSNCKLFIYISLSEGFGIPPLEAIACGARVITSNTSALEEIFNSLATTVDPYSVDDIVEKMRIVLSDNYPMNDRIKKSEIVRKKYNWPDIADRVWRELND